MLPIYDNHIHLSFSGNNVEAVKEFEKKGGTHLNLCNLPLEDRNIDKNYYREVYENTLKLADVVKKNTKVKIFVTLGPYPVDLLRLLEKFSLKDSVQIMKDGIELAGKYIEEKKAIAIGEIGRPHFPVSKEIVDSSNEIMKYGFEIAKDIDCAVVLHTESATTETFKEISDFAKGVGLCSERVVKHYSPPIVDKEKNYGIIPSVLANRKNVREAIKQGTYFFMETDYLDDLDRKDAVLPITSVPKRTKMLISEGYEEELWKIHSDNFKRVYGLEIV